MSAKLLIGTICAFLATDLPAKEKSKIALKIELSATVQEELISQMKTLQGSTQSTVEMVSKGQWSELKNQGDYLAKLTLSPIKNKSKLPDGFLKYAKELQDAGKNLSAAAGSRSGGQVLVNYYRILSTCMKCHADYAPNYFDHTKTYTPPEEFPVEVKKPTRSAPTLLPSDWR